MIDISDLKPAAVLAALYNSAKVQGLGFLQANAEDMTESEAQALLDEIEQPHHRFDYLYGRVMKVSIRNESKEFDPRLYDRDNGHGAAAQVVEKLREAKA